MAYSSIGRRRPSVSVHLNVYDLSPANEWCLHAMGLGLYHTGVEILGSEYTFAATAGVFHHSPKAAPQAKFRAQLLIGTFEGGPAEVQTALSILKESRFGPDDYDILQNNCNVFANALCLQLCERRIPDYINRIAEYGVFCKCLIPREILKGSPVQEQRMEQTAVLRTPQRNGGIHRNTNNSSAVTAFAGSGSKLGGTASSDALTDRREKARMAALTRLQQQQQQQSHESEKTS